MRNLKRALSLALASVMVLGMTVVGTGASYTDVTSKQNQEAIEVLQAVGIMVGDNNGNFNPDQKVTRNEMAVVMSNLMDYRAATYAGTSPFTDVPSWAEPYVAACWNNGITSGYTKTTYGGSDSVTTSQAALMLMKALGYFQYSSDFGTDWQFATVKQATKIELFDDVDSGVREAMTRNDLAQLVLNTLEAGTVEAEKDGQDIEVNGVTISSNVKYNFITSNKDYASSISDLRAAASTNATSGYIVELGEKLYSGDLKKDKGSDAFQRPANVWTYKSAEVGKYADSADGEWTAKVSNKALYNAVGSSAYDNYDWSVYRNGKVVTVNKVQLEDVKGKDVLNADKSSKTSNERVLTSGDGVLTQVYVDDTANYDNQGNLVSKGTVVLTMVDTGVAKVTKVTETDGEYEVTVAFKTKPEGQTNIDSKFTTDTKFAKDDIVVYTAADKEIKSMAVAKTVAGKVTAQADKDYTTLDGTKYGYNYAYKDNGVQAGLYNLEDSKKDDNPVIDKEATLYLDAYGYAVAFEGKSSTAEDYLFVKAIDEAYGDISAKVVFFDGTQKTIDIDKVDEKDATKNNVKTNTVYKYTAGTSDYDLTSVDNYTAGSHKDNEGNTVYQGEISNKTPSITDNKNTATTTDDTVIVTGDSQTVYVDVENNKTWTGYKNVSNKSNAGIAAVKNSDKVAEIVFIYGNFSSAANDDDFVILKSTDYETSKDANKKTVYRFTDAYDVNGEPIDNFYVTATAKEYIANKVTGQGKGLYLVKDYDDDYAKSMVICQKLEGSTTAGSGANNNKASVYAESAKNGVLTLSKAIDLDQGAKADKSVFSYNDKTTFIVIEQKNGSKVDTIRTGDIGDVVAKADAEDDYSNLTGVYVITVDNDDDTTPLATSVLVIVPYVK